MERRRFYPKAFARSGFTLVELLVVVGIISLLISILLPALSKARMASQQSKCMANLRSIGQALVLYANENRDHLPYSSRVNDSGGGVDAELFWINALRKYIGNVDAVRICPADPNGDDRLKAGGSSYVTNSFVFDDVVQLDPFGQPIAGGEGNRRKKFSQYRPSSEWISFMTISDRQEPSQGVVADHTHAELWFDTNTPAEQRWQELLKWIQPDRFTSKQAADRSNGRACYLFMDGHVESLNAADVKRLVDAGVNFTRPASR
jgi:prepilin-type N-terminal cleavage/methylation domain-containing protein/prepilin-type processing-associated H-X9-DG protein